MLNKIISRDFLMEMIYLETADDMNRRHGEEKGQMEERQKDEKEKKKKEISEEKGKLE